MKEKTVYRSIKYVVKRNDEWPVPRYMVYDQEGSKVSEHRSQVEATMWCSRH